MIRQDMGAGSANAFMPITNGNGASFQGRLTAGGITYSTAMAGITFPYWVKLVRSGNNFSGYVSPNGINWTQDGFIQTIPMNAAVYIGLAVNSLYIPAAVT